ncbi:WD domain, G-beta repeat-containing protein [Xylona heveae TC161]|uniref:Mitochondrial division protein 1 n=1 Tax=Xylona heveae (strain CBS 132557 / TC161) TaxID=1328760 RepID=A0A164ZPQ5_XYLHT|nr:WD domain, G-beta repeat-containing protein [Xylona heveae TC161]KZF19350.1 WD domain, G-beta repeat-containing protein [Xylona heveae TC161]
MAGSNDPNGSPPASGGGEDEPILGTALTARNIEAFGRKVTTTAGHFLGDPHSTAHYQNAITEIHRELRHPNIQRQVYHFSQTTPSEIVRSRLYTSEIHHRALAYLPDELLTNIPEDDNSYSLFQGFEATLPDMDASHHKRHGRHHSRGRKLLSSADAEKEGQPKLEKLKSEKGSLGHRLEMMAIRKNMCSAEIREIDNKIANLNTMRKIVLDRLASLEQEESSIEHDIVDVGNRLEDLEEEMEDAAALAQPAQSPKAEAVEEATPSGSPDMEASFMSASIYEKIPSPKAKRRKNIRRISMPILHEHFEPGSNLKEIQAHNDIITALDYDVPFGTMVTAALDDTVRVWDLSAGRCMGMLEGHHASVRCLQVEDNIVATGSMDATIRLWDLSRADYAPQDNRINKGGEEEDDEDALGFEHPDDAPIPPPSSSMQDCPLFSLEAHVDEVTALHFRGDTLVSGSADKTIRQWDLEKGRCVQTLDVLWAAAQASSTIQPSSGPWRQTGRLPDASADFVGALQCFDAALACGTADGMVRLWDLRSGQVHRSLVGHTGPVTCLQFDDVHLVTGSLDRSIRIWDLRTGSIFDAYAYDKPVTDMMFDTRRIVAAAGENVVKVYDKTDGRHWDCGAGVDAEEEGTRPAMVERVRIKDGYLTEGRKDGIVGIWAC